jgi:type II secretion system protein N
MKDVTLGFAPPQPPVHIEQITVSPSLLGLITGKIGGKVVIENRGGTLSASLSMKPPGAAPAKTSFGTPPAPLNFTFSFDAKDMDIGKLGILPALANVQGSALVNGNGVLEGDLNTPSTLVGQIQLELSKVTIDPQTIAGFSLPKLAVSEGKIDLGFDKSKATIKAFHLGKAGKPGDDIVANLTGDVTLGRNWDTSMLSVKAGFTLSQNILKSFSLIDALLGAGKQADGSYSYNLAGPLTSPIPAPVSAGPAPGLSPSMGLPPHAATQPAPPAPGAR